MVYKIECVWDIGHKDLLFWNKITAITKAIDLCNEMSIDFKEASTRGLIKVEPVVVL